MNELAVVSKRYRLAVATALIEQRFRSHEVSPSSARSKSLEECQEPLCQEADNLEEHAPLDIESS